jgi:hypothetical protein
VAVPGTAAAPVAAAVSGGRLLALGSVAEGFFRPRKVLAHG